MIENLFNLWCNIQNVFWKENKLETLLPLAAKMCSPNVADKTFNSYGLADLQIYTEFIERSA